MTYIIVGSTVASEVLGREPGDLDIWSDGEIPNTSERVDVFWDDRLYDWFGTDCRPATIDELYTMKRAHIYWDIHGTWDKHLTDMLRLENAGAQFLPELHNILYEVNEKVHGKKRVSLDYDKTAFFDDAVPRTYDHDSLHRSVTEEQPLYERFLKPGQTVLMDMEQVWAADPGVVLQMFREEIYVTALERWLIPNDYRFSPGRAYRLALKKTITSLTKGRSARFLAEHVRELLSPVNDFLAIHDSRRHVLERF